MRCRNWLLQKVSHNDQDTILLENLLRRDALIECGSFICAEDSSLYGTEFIPVGDIPFVEAWLQKNHKKHMVPVEVPKVLRTREFLGRSYQFMDRDKLPGYAGGKYFVKNVDTLKEFNSSLYEGRIPNPSTIPPGTYLLSEWVQIRSEFRVFVFHDEILAVQNYLGSPLVFPEAEKLLRMVKVYKDDDSRPQAYTMDVAVICRADQKAETVIMEVHPFVSCGLYGFCSPDIPDMLEAGISYYCNV